MTQSVWKGGPWGYGTKLFPWSWSCSISSDHVFQDSGLSTTPNTSRSFQDHTYSQRKYLEKLTKNAKLGSVAEIPPLITAFIQVKCKNSCHVMLIISVNFKCKTKMFPCWPVGAYSEHGPTTPHASVLYLAYDRLYCVNFRPLLPRKSPRTFDAMTLLRMVRACQY